MKIKAKKAAASTKTAANTEVETREAKSAEQAKTTAKTVCGIGFVIPEGYFSLMLIIKTAILC